jgi:hypothetical protein
MRIAKASVWALGIVSFAASAIAGQTYTGGVSIGSNYAGGTVVGAHNSPDSTQRISCETYSWAGGSTYGFCYASDASGGYKSCSTTNSALIAIMQSITPVSYIFFNVGSDGSSCNEVAVENGSIYY